MFLNFVLWFFFLSKAADYSVGSGPQMVSGQENGSGCLRNSGLWVISSLSTRGYLSTHSDGICEKRKTVMDASWAIP